MRGGTGEEIKVSGSQHGARGKQRLPPLLSPSAIRQVSASEGCGLRHMFQKNLSLPLSPAQRAKQFQVPVY